MSLVGTGIAEEPTPIFRSFYTPSPPRVTVHNAFHECPLAMEVDDGGANPKANSSADADWLHLDELPRPFDIVCDDLTGLGALSIEDFLSNTSSAGFDVSFHLQLPEILAAEKEKEHEKEKENAGKPVDDAGEEIPPAPKALKPVALLRQTGQAVFGSSDHLNYEFLEEDSKSMSFF